MQFVGSWSSKREKEWPTFCKEIRAAVWNKATKGIRIRIIKVGDEFIAYSY